MAAVDLSRILTEIEQLIEREGIARTPDGRISVLDVIEKAKASRFPSQELNKKLVKYPELRARITYGRVRGHVDGPLIQPEDLPLLLLALFTRGSRGAAPLKALPPPPPEILVKQPPLPLGEPYGWSSEPASGQVLCPVWPEQRVVDWIKKLDAFAATPEEIAAELARQKVDPRHGEPWTGDAIREILAFDHAVQWIIYWTFWEEQLEYLKPKK